MTVLDVLPSDVEVLSRKLSLCDVDVELDVLDVHVCKIQPGRQ